MVVWTKVKPEQKINNFGSASLLVKAYRVPLQNRFFQFFAGKNTPNGIVLGRDVLK